MNIIVQLYVYIDKYSYHEYSNIDKGAIFWDNTEPSRYFIYVSEGGTSLYCHYSDWFWSSWRYGGGSSLTTIQPKRRLIICLKDGYIANDVGKDIVVKLKFKGDDISEVMIDSIIFGKEDE